MKTEDFTALLAEHFKKITANSTHLYRVEVDKTELWNLYLDSMPAYLNKIFVERREFDCNSCRSFIRAFGNVVTIHEGKMTSIWDFVSNSEQYDPVLKNLSEFIHKHPISSVFFAESNIVGTKKNYSNILSVNGTPEVFHHLFLNVPNKFLNRTGNSNADVIGDLNTSVSVFKRSLDEISAYAIDTVLELIAQNSLYKGSEHKKLLTDFSLLKSEYDALVTDEEKSLFSWSKAPSLSPAITRIRNTAIGTLLVDISEGRPLDDSVTSYEKITAPSSYKRPKAIFTTRMLEDAEKKVSELGYQNSLGRRFATLDDITVNNILFSNKDASKRVQGFSSPFKELAKKVSTSPQKFSKVEEMNIDDFIKNVLPTTTSLEAFVDSKLAKNFVSLIAPKDRDAKSMFKWDNAFSWAYAGNITDSSMKERVKKAGGAVDGVLRFSIQWNDLSNDLVDLDAHCKCPSAHIYFGSKVDRLSTGFLDVDIISPTSGVAAVENISWSDLTHMLDGEYKFYVNNYDSRSAKNGFRAEIEFNGEIHEFNFNSPILGDQNIDVATVTLKNGVFSIDSKLPSTSSSKDIWNITTNNFVPVTVAMFSPNYWDEQSGIGHKHYFFMLDNCINDEKPNGFYNEFLDNELTPHRKVFEALGSQLSVEDVNDQLSGLGFSSTKRNELLIKATGNTERLLKLKF